MKLSKAQQKVVDLMRQGWGLRSTTGFEPSAWLRNKNGPTLGSITVSVSTLIALLHKGVIKRIPEHYPFERYELTEKGKK